MDLSPAIWLGHYEVLGRLGTGDMGVLCKAEDTRLGCNVALQIGKRTQEVLL